MFFYTDTDTPMASAFAALNEAGATLPDNESLYQIITGNYQHAHRLPTLFSRLKDEGITIKDHSLIYAAAIQHAQYADQIPLILKMLRMVGATPPEQHILLHTNCISMARHADNLLPLFALLKEAGATLPEHLSFFERINSYARHAQPLLTAFLNVRRAGATIENSYSLYEAISQVADKAKELVPAFETLEEAGATLPECGWIYKKITNVSFGVNTNKMSVAFIALREAGASIQDHPLLYEAAYKYMFYANELGFIFGSLREAGITLQTAHQPLWIAAIKGACSENKVAIVLASLSDAGITLQKEHLSLYKYALENAKFATSLPLAIKLLKEAGATDPKAHIPLFELTFRGLCFVNKLPIALDELKKAGATPGEYPSLYAIVLKHVHLAPELPTVFATLQAIGATLPTHLAVFEEIIPNINVLLPFITKLNEDNVKSRNLANKLLITFTILKSAGATPSEHQAVYKSAINNVKYADKLPFAFAIIEEIGATLQAHESLYAAIIDNIHFAPMLAVAFRELSEAGITLHTNPAFYEAIIQDARHTHTYMALLTTLKETALWPELQERISNRKNNHFTEILDTLASFGFKMPDDLDIIQSALIANNLDILRWLRPHGFKKNEHRFIAELFFASAPPLAQSPYIMSKVKHQLAHYLSNHGLPYSSDDNYSAQCETIKHIVTKVQEAENEITEGPLNKSDATKTTEAILKRIAIENINLVNLRFDDQLGYILQFNNEPEIYLTELLKLTNFNHIELSTEEIILLGNKIQSVAPDFDSTKILDNGFIVNNLPLPAKRALTCYINKNFFMNINRLFRGVAPTIEEQYIWIEPVEGRNSLIALFLIGCLVSWSAVTLPHLLHDSKERALLKRLGLNNCNNQDSYNAQLIIKQTEGLINQDEYNLLEPLFPELSTFFPNYSLVDRGDDFNDSEKMGELCTKKRFTANPGTFAPAIMSLSVFPQGFVPYHPPGSTATKIETDNSRPIVNDREGEILAAPGTSYRYAMDSTGNFFAHEVNSPGIVPNGGYWSSIALAEAFRNHLSKAYADSAEQIAFDNVSIPRPNHGLAHSYRKMVYIDIVINYFAHHAVDPAFRLFCQSVSPEEREWLRVTAAYSVTGRESELSPHDNLEKYNQYKEASKMNMVAFLDKYPPPKPDEAMRERMLDCVRWLGNPDYEQRFEVPADECEHRNFIHRILCVAHNLDLPRCRGPEQFEQDMAICRRHSVESAEQKDDYTHMVDYAAQLIQAHGDLVGGYQSPFEKVSTNLRQLREVTESVTRPKVREPYQFTTPHPQPFSP